MKNIRLLLDGKWIKDYVKGELNLYLFDGATVLYAIANVDWIIKGGLANFQFKSLKAYCTCSTIHQREVFMSRLLCMLCMQAPTQNFYPQETIPF